MKGQIIGGSHGQLLLRQRSGTKLEIGELLICGGSDDKQLLQVTDLALGSQLSSHSIELISGMQLEDNRNLELMDRDLRMYQVATVKSLLHIGATAKRSKVIPDYFTDVREVKVGDLSFLEEPKDSLFVGKLRSGSKVLDVSCFLRGRDVLSHHVLIPATTGKGKSNLTSVLLWDLVSKEYAGILVIDPHDEYNDRLKNHPSTEKVVYYTPKASAGDRSLKINIDLLRPSHFQGVVEWSTPQYDLIQIAFKQWGSNWIAGLVGCEEMRGVHEATLSVVKRRLRSLLGISIVNGELSCSGIFSTQAGESTIHDILRSLSTGCVVIVNTSQVGGRVELLLSMLLAGSVFDYYKQCKLEGTLRDKPLISIILEEAPRVLGKQVLENGPNIYSTIAREGRKFQVGLVAITQLPSLIPREVLANMNTKIILGIEMAPERAAIIDSAAQDLSDDNRNIASLDRGEAIISSNFSAFALPVKIPLFETICKGEKKAIPNFIGMK